MIIYYLGFPVDQELERPSVKRFWLSSARVSQVAIIMMSARAVVISEGLTEAGTPTSKVVHLHGWQIGAGYRQKISVPFCDNLSKS